MYTSLFPDQSAKNLVLLSAPSEFAPRSPGRFELWTFASRNGNVFFPAIVPRFFGNLSTDFASQINSAVSMQAAAVRMIAQPFERNLASIIWRCGRYASEPGVTSPCVRGSR